MGSNYNAYTKRIADNLQRIADFKTTKNGSGVHTTVSCKDTLDKCEPRPGKQVAGYAWTYVSFFGWWYHYITFCEPFYTVDTLSNKIDEVQKQLSSDDKTMATDLNWLRTTGQYFLHEMMHTKLADGGIEPHIIDEDTRSPPPNNDGYIPKRAYGPRNVHKLATNINIGGGAYTASTNADSYAILASALWWWDTTGYWPSDTGKSLKEITEDPVDLIMLHVDLDNKTFSTSSSGDQMKAAFTAELAKYNNINSDDPTDSDPPTNSHPGIGAPTIAP